VRGGELIAFSLFGKICLGMWGSVEAQDNDLVLLPTRDMVMHHRGE